MKGAVNVIATFWRLGELRHVDVTLRRHRDGPESKRWCAEIDDGYWQFAGVGRFASDACKAVMDSFSRARAGR